MADGDKAWTNPGNAATSNGSYATCADPGEILSTDSLRATNFSFAIPSDATIDGVVAEVEKKASLDTALNFFVDSGVFLIVGGAPVGNDKSIAGHWTTSDAYSVHGGAADMWGTTLTPAQVNASNFGFQIKALETSITLPVTASIDHMRITVYYTEAPAVTGNALFFQPGD